jgi:hypothetical protein
MREARRRLAAQDDFARGSLRFPNPDAVAQVQLEGYTQS